MIKTDVNHNIEQFLNEIFTFLQAKKLATFVKIQKSEGTVILPTICGKFRKFKFVGNIRFLSENSEICRKFPKFGGNFRCVANIFDDFGNLQQFSKILISKIWMIIRN